MHVFLPSFPFRRKVVFDYLTDGEILWKYDVAYLVNLVQARMLKSLAGCRTMHLFAVFCKIGALERNTY